MASERRREQRPRSVGEFMKSGDWSGYWTTRISRAEEGRIWVRGYPLEEIIEKLSFVEAMWLLLRGELPTKQQAAIWELTMKVAMDQQFISSAACAARFVASAHPESPIPAVAAGILAHGSVTGSPRPAAEMIQVMYDEEVPVFASGLGSPAPYAEKMHDHGMTIMAVIGTVRHAHKVTDGGTDIVIAQGTEGGGHTGRIATMALVPQVVDAIAPTPVVAAGGIADGRGLVAALSLGACGVWVGTRFVATREAASHDNYKHKIVEATEEGTQVTKCFTGKDCRVIKNRYMDQWEDRQGEIKPFPFQMMVDSSKMDAAIGHGDTDLGLMPAGQISGAIKEVKSAADVVREMMEEAEEVLQKLAEKHLELQAAQ